MSTLKFSETHNLIVFLEKLKESSEFEEIIYFLNANQIRYALTVNPTIYTSHIEQFWETIKVKTVNGELGTDCLALLIFEGTGEEWEVDSVDETQEMNDDNLMFDTGVLEEKEKDVAKKEVSAVDPVTTVVKSEACKEKDEEATLALLEAHGITHNICLIKRGKRVNTFVDMNTELVKVSKTKAEGSSKRVGDELEQEKAEKQKGDNDQEEAEMKRHI
ncbi:hypothetical protein Tco_0628513 [Tanacetum coccineum]|uniref:Xylulose kinase-1 n=1 Tax=Tanacetum coccineum TaxID=301880 RepID=A0ABQ4WQI5_9ASTR